MKLEKENKEPNIRNKIIKILFIICMILFILLCISVSVVCILVGLNIIQMDVVSEIVNSYVEKFIMIIENYIS